MTLRIAAALVLIASVCPAQTTLRGAAAQRSILFGTAGNADEFNMRNRLTEPDYAATLSRHFNMLEAENAMKWQVIRPTRERYEFGPGDKLAAFAAQNGMKLRGHVLVWHNGVPQWLTGFASSATPADMASLLEDHIRTVVSHYKGKIFAWDVVNESFTDPQGSAAATLRDSMWYNPPGDR